MSVTWEVSDGPAVRWTLVGDDPDVRWVVYRDGLATGGGSGPPLSNALPLPLDTVPRPGVAGAAARADHVHELPSYRVDDLTDVSIGDYAPITYDDVFTYTPTGWTNIPIRSMADSVGSAAISAGLRSHSDFARMTRVASIHEQRSSGTGADDPVQWMDARTFRGDPMDMFLEVAEIDVGGELRQRGLRPGAAAFVPSAPHPARWATVVVGEWWMSTGYADIAVGFVNPAGDGYLAHVCDTVTEVSAYITRNDGGVQTPIAGPAPLPAGMTTEGRRFTLTHNGSTFICLLDGRLLLEVEDATHDVMSLSAAVVLLNTEFGTSTAGVREFAWGTGGSATGGQLSAHKATHATGGSDELTAADIGAASAVHGHDGADITSGVVAPDRLGSGTPSAATFLRGDSTWAAPGGGSWPDSMPLVGAGPVLPGEWLLTSDAYAPGLNTNNPPGGTTSASNNLLLLVPLVFRADVTVTAAAVRITTANAGPSAVVRVGVWEDDGGVPGTLIVDSGTASINTVGVKIMTFGSPATIPAGGAWVGVVAQGLDTAGANPTISMLASNQRSTGSIPTPQDSNTAFRPSIRSVGVSGALASNPATSIVYTAGPYVPHVYLRRSV